MSAQWAAELIGKLHLYGITGKELAEEVGWHPKYFSRVINGHTTPRGAEAKLNTALDRLIKQKAMNDSQQKTPA